MRLTIALVLASCIPLFLAGCNPKLGIVVLDSNPSQATVYVGGKNIGETPVQFELDLTKPVSLRIIKEGYVPTVEFLTLNWAKQEYREGRYKKGDFFIQGEKQSGFEIQTTRVLQEDVAAKEREQRRAEEVKRYQEFVAWCNSMIGKDYHEIVNKLGLPGQTVEMPNGNKTMFFDRGVQGLNPRFETDSNGIVIRWTP